MNLFIQSVSNRYRKLKPGSEILTVVNWLRSKLSSFEWCLFVHPHPIMTEIYADCRSASWIFNTGYVNKNPSNFGYDRLRKYHINTRTILHLPILNISDETGDFCCLVWILKRINLVLYNLGSLLQRPWIRTACDRGAGEKWGTDQEDVKNKMLVIPKL